MAKKMVSKINKNKDHEVFNFNEVGSFRKITFLVQYQTFFAVFKTASGQPNKVEKNKSDIKSIVIEVSKSIWFDVNVVIDFADKTASFRSTKLITALEFCSELLNLEFDYNQPFDNCNLIDNNQNLKQGVINIDEKIIKKMKIKKMNKIFFWFSLSLLVIAIAFLGWAISTLI